MLVCPSCGAENRQGARFCDACGAALADPAQAREVRKVVTVLFCDVTGSTALGERIDPESLRRVMARYFETAKAIVERHGGTVEKFIGDAVMAVFGVPAVHEDDALRAVRAAHELRTGLGELNEELERGYGTRLELRMGVNTGEVVTGTEERLATGDAVNVAARLEQAAEPGEVLLGEETHRLVRDAVDAQPIEPLAAKGKAERLQAYRLVSVLAAAPERRQDVPMVGRARQRKLLEDAFAAAEAERSCHLFTILGTAGVGKSRLVDEFLRGLAGATVVRGRCLSYGEGISYWPVTEVVKQLVPDENESAALAPILGEGAAESPDEIAWAFRKLLESRAAERPLVVVFDDMHWGEPAFLDLVEHVADLSRGAPILLLCIARPELLDQRATWGGGKLNATNVLLEPLAPEEADELLEALTDGIAGDLRERILEAAGGNPLFVEEMVAMAAEEGGEITVPPTIQALLAARLDQLEPAERGVLERGAVEGLVFHRGAVAALTPEEQVDGRLVTLVRKDLVRPEQAVLAGDDAYRFRHLLIRDTAYEALPKAARAELHERFALWLEEHGAALVELDEILGYHLEQAYRYRTELGPLDERAEALGARAAERLLRGGERAEARSDDVAAERLLGRAAELLPENAPGRRQALASRAHAVSELGRFAEAAELREQAVAAAEATGDEALLARLTLIRIEAEIQSDPDATMVDALAATQGALATLERLGDEHGAVWALRLIGCFQAWLGRSGDAERTWLSGLERAAHANPRAHDEILGWLLWETWWGPESAEDGLLRCEEYIRQMGVSGSRRFEGIAYDLGGVLKAYLGRVDEGRADMATGRGILRDLGDVIWWAGAAMLEGELEFAAGDPQRAYDALTEGQEALAAHAETGYLATTVGMRSQAALLLGWEDEALELADEAERLAQRDDFEPRSRITLVRARVLARRGDFERADELLAEGTRMVEGTDYVFLYIDLHRARAEVHRLAGRTDDEREALEKMIAAAEQKGHLLAVEEARARLAEL